MRSFNNVIDLSYLNLPENELDLVDANFTYGDAYATLIKREVFERAIGRAIHIPCDFINLED